MSKQKQDENGGAEPGSLHGKNKRPSYSMEELLKKDKAELDVIKTALEISQSEEKFKFERSKFKTENLRFFLIAIITAAISLASSYFLERVRADKDLAKENREEIRKQFDELKKNFKEEQDATAKNNLACDIANFDNSNKDVNIERTKNNFIKFCVPLSALPDQVVISAGDTTSEKVQKTLASLDKELFRLKQEQKEAPQNAKQEIEQKIIALDSQVQSVVKSAPELKKASASSESNEARVQLLQMANAYLEQEKGGPSLNKSEMKWFKKGYFLEFGEYRITLQDIDKTQGIWVDICKTKNNNCVETLRSNAPITIWLPLEFTDGNRRLRVNLEAIDRAGKNPFNLAAYITFETVSIAQAG